MAPVVVTTTPLLDELLVEWGLVASGVRVVPRPTREEIEGRHVLTDQVLPLDVAALAERVTQVRVTIPPSLAKRGALPLDRLRVFTVFVGVFVVRSR